MNVKFNCNQHVRVKLTEHGIKILAERHKELLAAVPTYKEPFRIPHRDADGYSSFQLWTLMLIFGPHMGMCMPNPFELDVLLEPSS